MHHQTHQKRCDEFQQFDPTNSFTKEPSKSLLKSANTTNVPITVGNENTALEAPTENGKVNTLVGDSIVSGINGKGLSTDKFTTVVHDIPGATSDDMVYHKTPFAEKKLIFHACANDFYSNIYRNHWKLRKNI